ncbi:MAG: carboxypeptidase-like regulatory domain-containing protein [Ignavibacteriota bacterium]
MLHATRLVVIASVVSVLLWGQFGASLQGTVTDSSGAVVPTATVTLTNSETKQKYTGTTSNEGFYRFTGLAPGRYSLSVEVPNFKRTVMDIPINAEQSQGANVTLTPGAVAETVNVSGEGATLVQTENAQIGQSLTTREVDSLPQFGRDPYELMRLTPNTTSDMARAGNGNSVSLPNSTGPGGSNFSIFQTENMVPVSANGQRVSDNNFLIDGVSVNSLGWGRRCGGHAESGIRQTGARTDQCLFLGMGDATPERRSRLSPRTAPTISTAAASSSTTPPA